MIRTSYPIFASISAIFWVVGTILLLFERHAVMVKFVGRISVLLGSTVLSIFILLLWLSLDRPPIRTIGETRLWFCVFLTIIGYLVYLRWKFKVVLILSVVIAVLFLWINYQHPEAYEKTLAPALQSLWLIPHVVFYIASYAALGMATLVAIAGLFFVLFRKFETEVLTLTDNLVYIGFSLLTLGMLFGAIWAKQAWGHYWTWDPKETWSLLTWLVYMLYIHFRYNYPNNIKTHLFIVSLSFIVLLIGWFGLSYLPSAPDSVHVFIR